MKTTKIVLKKKRMRNNESLFNTKKNLLKNDNLILYKTIYKNGEFLLLKKYILY